MADCKRWATRKAEEDNCKPGSHSRERSLPPPPLLLLLLLLRVKVNCLHGETSISMTSVQFHIDSRSRGGPSMRVLHGRNADDYERQRERNRRNEQSEPGAEGRSAAFAMELMDRNAPQQIGQRGGQRQGGMSSAARFASMGGRQLDLDNMDYEELHEMFPSHTRQGVPPSVLEHCSNVFKFHPTT
eukprot:661103-Hanusia_phi.AAC.1